MQNILLALLLILISNPSWNQNSKEEVGDKYFRLFEYQKAIDNYEKEPKLSIDGQRNLRMSYSRLEKYNECEALAAKIVSNPAHNSEDIFEYVSILRTNKKYDASQEWMQKYEALVGNDQRIMADHMIRGRITDLMVDQGTMKVENLGLNTELAEFAPVFYGGKFVFTGASIFQAQENLTNNAPKQNYLRLFVLDTNELNSIKRVFFNEKVAIKYNEGVACFSSDLKTMVFSGNDIATVELGKKINVQLYFVQNDSLKGWGEPVPFKYNDSRYSFGHPFLTSDGKTLYFSSNRLGSIGGSDIWKCIWENGEWSEPINLGNHINTESNEFYPFYLESAKTLFFASDGRGGLGGLDIFVSNVVGDFYDFAQNLGSPINSNVDDFSFITNPEISRGYFASNREGGKGNDDIYTFAMVNNWKPKKIIRSVAGVVKDDNGKPLPNTLISFVINENDSLKGVLTDENGYYSAILEDALTGQMNVQSIHGKVNETFVFHQDSISLTRNFTFKTPKKLTPLKDLERIGNSVYFETAKWDLDKKDELVLDYYVKSMMADSTLKVSVSGFADVRYTPEANEYWSKMRMRTVVAYLTSHGVAAYRIEGNFYGETADGIDPNDKKCLCTSKNLEWCRRADLKLYR